MSESKTLLLAYEAVGEMREVVFAISTNQARAMLTAVVCSSPEASAVCKRAPWADKYAQIGRIPLSVRAQRGLSVKCSYCKESIAAADGAVLSDTHAFCTSVCEEKFASQRAILETDLNEAAEIALALWPEVKVLKAEMIDGRARVHFTFGSPARHAFWFVDEDQVQVAPVDDENWFDFNARMRLSRPAL